MSAEWFIEHFAEEVVKEDPPSVDAMLDIFVPRGSDEYEMRPVAESVLLAGNRARAFVLTLERAGAPRAAFTVEAARATGDAGAFEPGLEQMVLEAAFKAHAARVPLHVSSPYSFSVADLAVPTPSFVIERQDRLIRSEEDLDQEIRDIEARSHLLRDSLSRVARPKGVVEALVAVAAVTVTGIVFPWFSWLSAPSPRVSTRDGSRSAFSSQGSSSSSPTSCAPTVPSADPNRLAPTRNPGKRSPNRHKTARVPSSRGAAHDSRAPSFRAISSGGAIITGGGRWRCWSGSSVSATCTATRGRRAPTRCSSTATRTTSS